MAKTIDNSNEVLIVCALMPEAKPIIAEYKLHFECSEYGFKLYRGGRALKKTDLEMEHGDIFLLVTGVAKVNMAAAMMWVRQYCQFESVINIGVAGHASLSIGDVVLINKVIDDDSGKAFYPSINFRWRGQQSALKTVSLPTDEYSVEYAFDMEASAFFEIANRCVTTDKIHILKVISDNADNPYQELTAQSLQADVVLLLDPLKALLNLVLSGDMPEYRLADLFELMAEKWHLTATREIQLKEILYAIIVMEGNIGSKGPDWQSHRSVTTYLQDCREWLKNIKPKIN